MSASACETRSTPDTPRIPHGSPGSARSIGDLCFDLLDRFGLWFLLLLLAVFVASSVDQSHRKRLWYDEIFSVIVASQPTWHRFAQAMPADGNPPLYALLTRLSIHLFGLTDLSVRLPSIVFFSAALIGIYAFVRKECGGALGVFAVVLALSEPGWQYAFEARPYAMLLAFMMLGLLSWQSATRAIDASPPRPRRLALAGMAIAIAGSILSHNIGIIEIGLPLLFGEAIRIYQTRRFDWPLLATGLIAIPALAITLPMMHRTRDLLLIYSRSNLHPLTLAKLHRYWITDPSISWPLLMNSSLLRMLAIVAIVTWTPRWLNGSAAPQRDPANPVPGHILAATFGAAILIPVTLLVMMSSGYYNCRYGIGCIAGISILLCLLLARTGRKYGALCMTLMVYFLFTYVHSYITSIHDPITRSVDIIDDGYFAVTPELPIVVTDPYTFLPDWYYAPPNLKNRFTYLADKSAAIKNGYAVVEVALTAEKPTLPVEDWNTFLSTHDHFLLCVPNGGSNHTIKERLEASGYENTPVLTRSWGVFYSAHR